MRTAPRPPKGGLFFSCNEITLFEGYLIAEKKRCRPSRHRAPLWGTRCKKRKEKKRLHPILPPKSFDDVAAGGSIGCSRD